jgi:hypothetical protein
MQSAPNHEARTGKVGNLLQVAVHLLRFARMKPSALNDSVMFRYAGSADISAIVALVESAYRGESSRAGWTTEADILGGQRTDATEVGGILAGCARRYNRRLRPVAT